MKQLQFGRSVHRVLSFGKKNPWKIIFLFGQVKADMFLMSLLKLIENLLSLGSPNKRDLLGGGWGMPLFSTFDCS